MRENVGFKNPTYNAVFSDGLILLRNKDRVRRLGATHPTLGQRPSENNICRHSRLRGNDDGE